VEVEIVIRNRLARRVKSYLRRKSRVKRVVKRVRTAREPRGIKEVEVITILASVSIVKDPSPR